MLIEIDFQSDEAIYMQLRNQIILGIATSLLQEGDTLPSVRQLADDVGINMHTVNKAYSVLRQEGFVTIDRRRGAVVALDNNKAQAIASFGTACGCFLQRVSAKISPGKRFTRWWTSATTTTSSNQIQEENGCS